MSATIHDLLARRDRRHQAALHFRNDVEALTYAAERIDELLDLADEALLLDTERLRLPLSQAASILRACKRLHTTDDREHGQ
ncbi:MAG TPA: hypothetical protein VNP20_17215 [Nocardioidaceae bacterium]|nr:hypothetical protein [Nocardioidaceae bacterium]